MTSMALVRASLDRTHPPTLLTKVVVKPTLLLYAAANVPKHKFNAHGHKFKAIGLPRFYQNIIIYNKSRKIDA